jgi:hypothetical protein
LWYNVINYVTKLITNMFELKSLKENWMIIGLIATMIIWYANTNSRLTAVEQKQVAQQATLDKVDTLITDLAVIKANVEFIKERIK